MLPDRSLLIGQKLVKNAKIQNFKCDILSNFQTMWRLGYKKRASLDDDYLCHVEVEKTKIAWVRILITNRVSAN